MGKLEAMIAAHGWREVEAWAWAWASEFGDGEKRAAIENALALAGVDGIRHLYLRGSALGGLDAADVQALLLFAGNRLGRSAAAA
ncbi:hypothetical protein [Microbacterium sp.]|uniref:hypothetical protein n=1 Tax=Microbacterium sp. TaxID=51671 RepID=UPI0028119E0C|nr:hypothetical protein [Microbacterium sp.]